MKKLLSLLLAAIMLFTLGFSAVADENDDPTTYLSIMNNDYAVSYTHLTLPTNSLV